MIFKCDKCGKDVDVETVTCPDCSDKEHACRCKAAVTERMWNSLWAAIVNKGQMLVAEPDPDRADLVYIRDMHKGNYCMAVAWNGEEWMTQGCKGERRLADVLEETADVE